MWARVEARGTRKDEVDSVRQAQPQMDSREWPDSVIRKDISVIAKELQEWLTQRLVAYIMGLSDAGDIGRYARKESVPRAHRAKCLRDLYMMIEKMREHEDDRTIQAWFVGKNLLLGEQSPAKVLRANFEEHFSEVSGAIEKFLDR